MANSLNARLGELKAKGSSARFASSESERNILSDEKRAAGKLFERGLNRSGLTVSQAADRISNGHGGAICRVTSGLDIPPVVARWLLDPALLTGLIEALAERPGDKVTVKAVVEIAR